MAFSNQRCKTPSIRRANQCSLRAPASALIEDEDSLPADAFVIFFVIIHDSLIFHGNKRIVTKMSSIEKSSRQYSPTIMVLDKNSICNPKILTQLHTSPNFPSLRQSRLQFLNIAGVTCTCVTSVAKNVQHVQHCPTYPRQMCSVA